MKRILENTSPSFEIEAGFFAQGYKVIAGIDEAGRGCLAGPLTVGMVVFSLDTINAEDLQHLAGINDSKKLTASNRIKMREIIRSSAIVCEYVHVSIHDIDILNINGATLKGVAELVKKSPVKPDCVIMDGNFKFKLDIPFYPVIKGDAKSISIASASIIAKSTRDELMDGLEESYPGYGLSVHKGYGTEQHRSAIYALGPSDIHRKTFEPVKSMLNTDGVLFV
jgi:ribonuclease HII